MPIISKRNKITLTPEEIVFIQQNWNLKTNQELADALGLKITRMRAFLAELGLKRIEMEYWTEEQTSFLIHNYKKIGDCEMAEIFNSLWPKKKTWTKKHIEKKRRYLELKRTKVEQKKIHLRNVENGRFKICPIKAWEKRGVSKIGTIRFWKHSNGRTFVVIKTNAGYEHYNRWIYIQKFGELKPTEFVVPKIGEIAIDGIFKVDQLEVISMTEHACRNTERRMEYPEELRKIIRLSNKLKKQLNTKNHEK